MYKTEYTHDDRGDDVFEVHCPDGVVLICLSEPSARWQVQHRRSVRR